MTFLGLLGTWLTAKLIDAILEAAPHIAFQTPSAAPPVGPPRGAGGRRPARRPTITLPQERPPAGTAAVPATVRASSPAGAPPWPQVEARDLPPFPGPGWEPDAPPARAVVQRANALLPILWDKDHGKGWVKIEQTAGRWIAYQATAMGSGGSVKGVVAHRLRGQGTVPSSVPSSSPARAPSNVTTLPETVITARAPNAPREGTRTVSTSNPSAVALPTLKVGSRGPDVVTVQRRLGLTPDGIFGPKTASAVQGYQRSHGLAPDGIVGPKTWVSLLGADRAA